MPDRHSLGNVLRNLATALIHLAERVDPQPPVEWGATFTVFGDGTPGTTNPATVRWRERPGGTP